MKHSDIVILAAKRTPIGSFNGVLASVPATRLGASAIQAALAHASIDPARIGEVIMGCVLQAGLGQAPARQAARAAGIPDAVGSTTVNKVCASGMKAIMLGHDMLLAGSLDMVVAGGMESMSGAPYLLPGVRSGYRLGSRELLDHMVYDGLRNAYDGRHMGEFAELCVERFGFTREQQDAYAISSVERAQAAVESGVFRNEICPVTVKGRGGEQQVSEDEEPGRCDISRIPDLKPVFRPDGGSVTAANSASISDGAAALVLTTADEAYEHGLEPMARILAHASHARDPSEFTIAPISAIRSLYQKTGWSSADVDLYEINEAFAAVAMAAMQELQLDRSQVNINGGACALGHPIGATGARLVVSLVHALKRGGHKRGIAALCIGGGEATALALELP